MHAERTEDVADVVADRLDAQVQLPSDLVGGSSVLEQPQDFGLTRRHMRMRGPRRRLVDVGDLAEHPDHVMAFDERDGAQLDPDPLSVHSDHDDLAVVRLPRPGEVAREDLP